MSKRCTYPLDVSKKRDFIDMFHMVWNVAKNGTLEPALINRLVVIVRIFLIARAKRDAKPAPA